MNKHPSQGTITRMIAEYRAGDRTKSRKIFERCFGQLCKFTAKIFGTEKSGYSDHEDIALSVLNKLYEDPDLYEVTDRKELLRLLCRMARNSIISERREINAIKRGGGTVVRLSELGDIELEDPRNLRDSMHDPSTRAAISDQLTYLKSKHNDTRLDQICELILLGHTYAEIAKLLSLSERSVDRKVKLIRSIWSETMQAEERRRVTNGGASNVNSLMAPNQST